MGVRSDEEPIKYLEIHMLESSQDVLDDAEGNLVYNTPEAYVQREIGWEKERRERRKHLIDSKVTSNDASTR